MGNYGTLYASFYNTDLELLYDNNGVLSTTTGVSALEVLSASGRGYWKGVGYGEFTIPPNDNTYPLIQVGHLCVVYQQDQIGAYQGEIACFIVQEIQVDTSQAVPVLRVSGPEITHELSQILVWEVIGEQDQSGPGDYTLWGNFAIGDTEIVVTNNTGVVVNSNVTIIKGVKYVYKGKVTEVNEDGQTLTVTPPLYNDIVGLDCDVFFTDYSNPTTSDINKITSKARQFAGWSLSVEGGGNGTTAGTSHAPNGASTLDLLNAAADITGEWWRLGSRAAGNVAPIRTIEWRKTADSTGITLRMPTQANALADVTNANIGVIAGRLIREYSDARISHLIAYGGGAGNDRITLADATAAAPVGYTVTVNNIEGYAVLINDALETEFAPSFREAIVNFGHIAPSGATDEEIEQAGNQLLDAAVAHMEAVNEKRRFYRVRAVINKTIRPGQTINLAYTDEWLDLTINGLYIVEYTHQVGADGVRYTDFLLSEALQDRLSGNAVLAKAVASNSATLASISAPATQSAVPTQPGSGSHLPLSLGASQSPSGGLTLNTATQRLSISLVDGDGIVFTGSTVKVDLAGNSGLNFDTGKLALGLPLEVSATSTNALTGTQHSHSIDATTDASLAPAKVLKSTAAGKLTLAELLAATLNASSGDLTITAPANVVLGPTFDVVVESDMSSDTWASGTTGWGIGHDGNADFRNLQADSVKTDAFVADVYLAQAGSRLITKSLGILSQAFTVPAVSSTANLYVADLPGFSGVGTFGPGDYIKIVYRGSVHWGTVTAVGAVGDGTFRYTWTTVSSTTVGEVIPEGAACYDYGQVVGGYIEDTALDLLGPYSQVVTFSGAPSTSGNHTVRLRIGNLDGISGESEQYGLFAGDKTTDTWVILSDTKHELHGVKLSLYDGGVETARIDPAVPSMGIGSTLPTGPQGGGDGFWTGKHSGAYKVRIGGTPTSGNPALVWDGTSLELRNGAGDEVIGFSSSGNSYFAGVMTIDTAGEIRQGTGTWGSTFDGIRIHNNSGEGNFSCYTTGTQAVTLNGDGITIKTVGKFSAGSIDWYDTLPSTNRKLSMGVEVDLGSSVAGYIETPLDLNLYVGGLKIYDQSTSATLASFDTTSVEINKWLDVQADATIGGLLTVDRGTNDGIYFQLLSDVDQPFTSSIPQYGFAAMRKVNDTGGGLAVIGASSSDIGLDLRGMAATTNSTTGTGGKAPIQLQGFASNGSTGLAAVASGNNLMVVRNNFSTQLIVKGNGDLYINGTSNTYDEYDDVALARALDLALDPAGLIRTEFDAAIQYNEGHLKAAGILGEDGRMINFTQLARLHNGALHQLHRRIAELEGQLKRLTDGKTNV